MSQFEGFSGNLPVGADFLAVQDLDALAGPELAALLAGKSREVGGLHLLIAPASSYAVLVVRYR